MENNIKFFAENLLAEEGYRNIEVGGKSYSIKLLTADNAWKIAQVLIEMLAPIVGRFLDSAKTDELDEENSFGLDLGILISKQLSNMDLVGLSTKLLNGAKVEGLPLDRDKFLGAKGMMILYELTEFALKENCLDFLVLLLDKKGLKIPSMSEIQKNLTAQTLGESNN